MNRTEQQMIDTAENQDEMFIRLWTQKEAVLKRNGTGITDHLKDLLQSEPTGTITTWVDTNRKYAVSIAE